MEESFDSEALAPDLDPENMRTWGHLFFWMVSLGGFNRGLFGVLFGATSPLRIYIGCIEAVWRTCHCLMNLCWNLFFGFRHSALILYLLISALYHTIKKQLQQPVFSGRKVQIDQIGQGYPAGGNGSLNKIRQSYPRRK